MEELAKDSYFIVGTGIVTILGFIFSIISLFMVSKIYKIKIDNRIDELNNKIDNSINVNQSKTEIKSHDKSTVLKDSKVTKIQIQ